MAQTYTLFVRYGNKGFGKLCFDNYKREELVDLVQKKLDFRNREEIFLSYEILGCGDMDLHDEEEMECMFRLVKQSGKDVVNIQVRRVGGKGKEVDDGGSSDVVTRRCCEPVLVEEVEDPLMGAVVKKKFLSDEWRFLIKGVSQKFCGGAVHFRRDLVKYSLVMGFEFDFVKNSLQKVLAVCKLKEEKGCRWKIKAVVDVVDSAFVVTEFDRNHVCGQTVATSSKRRFDNRMASEVIVEDIRNMPSLSPVQVQALVRKNYGLSISYCMAWKAMERGRSVVFGDHTKSFNNLQVYFEELKVNNPGSYTHLDVDENKKFRRCFFALEACLAGFKHCRPLMMVDGTFLKGKHKGCLLSAVAKDGEDGIFPVAFAVVNEESNDNWMYFFVHLSTAINESRDIVFISDRNSGILNGVGSVFPESAHAFCYNHLKSNLEYRCKGMGKKMRSVLLRYFQKSAFALSPDEYEVNAEKMIKLGGDRVKEFLEDAPKEKWAIAFFGGSRYGQMTSNSCESWNAQIREERLLPIVSMIDGIRAKLMKQMSKRRQEASGWQTVLCKSVENDMNRKVDESRGWDVRKASDVLWEVFSDPVGIVDLTHRSCSCMMWQVKGIPCVHAACVIFLKLQGMYLFVDPYYLADAYRATYDGVIVPFRMPVAGEEDVVQAPKYHQVRGRPKKRRIPSQGEVIARKIKCGQCGQIANHNKKTCRSKRDEE